jgi:hypothetical protein
MRGGAMNALAFMAERCDSLSTTARVAAASSCWIARLTGLEAVIQPKKRRGKRGQKKGSLTPQQEAVSNIDRDLLLLLDPSAEGPWHPRDFNADAHPEEVMLAAEPLRKLFDRATEVLQVYPGNELLVQVCQVAAKISALHTSTPVGKLLMTVQLLLVKAQEWEQYAAKHVSLKVEMAALSMLIGRWRELELKSWGDLLRCKEQSFVQVGYICIYTCTYLCIYTFMLYLHMYIHIYIHINYMHTYIYMYVCILCICMYICKVSFRWVGLYFVNFLANVISFFVNLHA